MLHPQGVGFLALNAQCMIERDTEKFRAFSLSDLDRYIRDELSTIRVNWLVFDVDLSMLNEYMNGNIRLVMRKGGDHA